MNKEESMTIKEFVESVMMQLAPFGVREVGFRLRTGAWPEDDRGGLWSAAVGHGESEVSFSVTYTDEAIAHTPES